jgi:hypothetical protein
MKVVFRNEEKTTVPFRVPHVGTTTCHVVIDAAVDAWIAKLQRVVMTQLQQSTSQMEEQSSDQNFASGEMGAQPTN